MTAIRLVIEKIWHGTTLTGDDLVVLVLLLTMTASTTHLLTMLITRWGDRYIAFKSLAGSLLVHTVCILGLEVFDPLQSEYVRETPEIREKIETAAEILLQSDDQVDLSHSGNTAIVDHPTEPQIDPERLQFEGRKMEPETVFERKPEVPEGLDTKLPDATEFVESPQPELTAPMYDGLEGQVEVAAQDPGAEIVTFQERNDADIYTADAARTLRTTGNLEELDRPDTDRVSATGRTDTIDTQINMKDTSIDLATSDVSSGVEVRLLEREDGIARRSAPVTGVEPVEMASTDHGIRPERTLPARSFEDRLSRPERAAPSRTPEVRPSRAPSKTPRTPTPLSSSYEEVRVGMTVALDSDSLRSAAEMVEMSTNRVQRRFGQPAVYRLRSREYRRDAVWQFGGTERSESAVERSLQWLDRQQSADGRWNAAEYGAGLVAVDEHGVNRDYAGKDADTGITALVTLAFLGAGYTHENGRYAVRVDRALDWLISQQDEDGSLAGEARRYSRMYCHAMATYAIGEALGMQSASVMDPVIDPDLLASAPAAVSAAAAVSQRMTGLPAGVYGTAWCTSVGALADSQAWRLRRVHESRLRSALLKAVRFTIRQQDKGGGWRYSARQEGDVSMFGWQLMSLKSAEIAGVSIPSTIRDRMFKFIDSVRQGKRGGLFGYRRGEMVTPAMTAEALFCQQMLGYLRDTRRNQESVEYLLGDRPQLSELNLYYWYYGTLAMYQHGGKPWEEWNSSVRDTLISLQVSEGDEAGSWAPSGTWGRYGGRLYSTALATLTLEVYYRLLPLYRMNTETEVER